MESNKKNCGRNTLEYFITNCSTYEHTNIQLVTMQEKNH